MVQNKKQTKKTTLRNREFYENIAKDDRSYKRIAEGLDCHYITLERNMRKLGLKKVSTKLSDVTKERQRLAAKSGEENPCWKGEKVSYKRLHIWIGQRKPKPIVCEDCKEREPYDLANISGKYKRSVDDFKWICRRCHMKNDGRNKNLIRRDPNAKRDEKGRFIKRNRGEL